jgi:hypothetical protein
MGICCCFLYTTSNNLLAQNDSYQKKRRRKEGRIGVWIGEREIKSLSKILRDAQEHHCSYNIHYNML